MRKVQRIVDSVADRAASMGDKGAVICGSQQVTYSQLFLLLKDKVKDLSSLAGNSGVGGSKYMVIPNTQNLDFVVTYLSVHYMNRAAVPVEDSTSQEKIAEIESLLDQCEWDEDVADILFTTGTTGKSKGVLVSHRAIVADADNLMNAQGFCEDTVFVISGPLNHIGSLSKVWATLYAGGCVYITDGMKDMDAFLKAFEYPSVKLATFLVPASIRMLLAFGKNKLQLLADRIDFIETGAAPISQSDMEQLCSVLPHTRLYNTYASTETGIISTYDYNSDECIAGCLGRTMKHSTLFITEEGNVACKGDTIMSGYVGDPLLTKEVLRDGTIYTNDKGIIDAKGRLQLQGRDGDVINIGGYKINPIEVEGAAMAFSDVKDCICISSSHPILGTVLKLLVVLEEDVTLNKKALARHLSERLERYKVPQQYEAVDAIKRTYNGKLDRKHYRA